MESKSMKENNFTKLLINEIISKKNWFIISFITIFITAVFVPMLMYKEISSVGVAIAVVELFLVVFLNCIIDFSYLHDSRKFSYYMSKPIQDIEKINVILLSNMIFSGIFMIMIGFISIFSYESIGDMFIVAVPWMIIGIFLSALSSVLVGNSIVAGIATCFNFLVPLSFLAVVYYIFHVIEIVAKGFNNSILMDIFIEKYYRIENLYFFKYAYDSIDASFFVLIVLIPALIYLVTRKLIKKRKNERIGEFIVFDGYKNFISILVSSLIPIAFLAFERDMGFFSQILAFIILASLSYYIILVVLDKSFRIRKNAVKILAIFLSIFVIFTGVTNISVKKFESYIPDIENVEGVYISNGSWIYSEELGHSIRIYDIYSNERELERKFIDSLLYKDKENISNIMNLHKELMSNNKYFEYKDVSILYRLKNGKSLVRYYSLDYDENYVEKNEIEGSSNEIILSDEYKLKNFKFIYDDEFAENSKIINMEFYDGNLQNRTLKMNDLEIKELRSALKKDYDNALKKSKYKFEWLLNPKDANSIIKKYKYDYHGDTYAYSEDRGVKIEKEYYLEMELYGKKRSITYYFGDDFTNTLACLEKFLKK